MGWVAFRFGEAAIFWREWRSLRLFPISLLIFAAVAPRPAASQTAPVQVNQNFISQGPGPRSGLIENVQSADAAPNGTGAGAVQAILPDPALGANTYFVGSPNGGVWTTSNGGTTWTPLTDKQSSLSIASLGLDPTDPTGKTIIAGIGITDNGEYSQFNLKLGEGGAQTGLLYTTNGGATWSNLGGTTLAGQSVIGVEARGNTILAATFEVEIADHEYRRVRPVSQHRRWHHVHPGFRLQRPSQRRGNFAGRRPQRSFEVLCGGQIIRQSRRYQRLQEQR